MRTAMKLFGIFASLSAFSLMSGVSLAATRPQSPMQTVKANNVSLPVGHPTPSTPPAFSLNGPIVNSNASLPTSFPLTAQQLQTTINTVNDALLQHSNGTITVSDLTLEQDHLTNSEISWAQHAITSYDQRIDSRKLHPVLGAHIPYSLPVFSLLATPLDSTAGLPYTWFISRTGHWYTEYFWWGSSKIANNTATKKLVRILGVISGGGTVAGLLPWELGWLAGLTGAVVGAYAGKIQLTNAQGGGFGVHLNFVVGPIPVGIFANVP